MHRRGTRVFVDAFWFRCLGVVGMVVQAFTSVRVHLMKTLGLDFSPRVWSVHDAEFGQFGHWLGSWQSTMLCVKGVLLKLSQLPRALMNYADLRCQFYDAGASGSTAG